jgi:hypothetical protein
LTGVLKGIQSEHTIKSLRQGGPVKKSIVLSLAVALLLLAGTSTICSSAQDTANDNTPTFYRLIPGTCVNPWPRFTITYPKDWVARPLTGGGFFVASSTEPMDRREGVSVYAVWDSTPLDKYADWMVAYYKRMMSTDPTLVSDKPSRLRDGTPARELEFKMTMNGLPWNTLLVATRKGDILVSSNVSTRKGVIGEDLRAIAYSFQYGPGNDEPVKVPPDVQEFLDRWSNDVLSQDVAGVMANFSDKYLNTGARKKEMEQHWRQVISSLPPVLGKMVITDFVPEGDKAYLAGFVIVPGARFPIQDTSIIKENGKWKWYGNQREVVP